MSSLSEAVSVGAGAFSALAALAAVYIAVRTERRARLVAATQLLLTLSQRFFDTLPRLGELGHPPRTEDEQIARVAYWHGAYLEWFLTKQFAPKDFAMVWDLYFERAALSGLAHAGLRDVLTTLVDDKQAGFGMYAGAYVDALNDAARRHGVPTV